MDPYGTTPSETSSALLLCNNADVCSMVEAAVGHLCTICAEPRSDTRLLFIYAADNMLPDLLFIANQCRQNPNLRPILISPRPFDHLFETLSHHGIFHVLNVGAYSFPEAMQTSVEICLGGNAQFALPDLPGIETTSLDLNILTRKDYQDALIQFEAFFRRQDLPPERLWEMRLLLDEAFNNALFHGFQDEDGMEKYSHEAFTGLYDNDLITIKMAAQDSMRSVLVVSDNAGTLEPDRILSALNRQISRHGIFDRRGRGLYLMRRLSDRAVFNIAPGRMAQVQLFFTHQLSPAWKNLEINLAPGHTHGLKK